MKAVVRFLTMVALTAGALGFAGAAQAHSDVAWSLSIGSPGVGVGVVQPGPVIYGAPVYVQPRPVYRVQRHHYRPQPYMRRHHRGHYSRPSPARRHGHYRGHQRWHYR